MESEMEPFIEMKHGSWWTFLMGRNQITSKWVYKTKLLKDGKSNKLNA
jgi:hypothetical protein